ncbi:MAG: oligosaccharide flippase family protein [Bacteroidota bacterium]
MSVLKKLAGQTVIYGSSIILARLLNLSLTPLYTNLFSEETYGIYTNLYAYVAFVNVIFTFGMETTFFRFLQDKEDQKKVYQHAFYWVGLMALVLSSLAALIHPFLATIMKYEGQEHLILMLIGIVFLDGLAALPLAKLRQEERIKWFATITLTNVVVSIAANLVFVYWLRLGIEYVFVANLIASTIRTGMSWWKNLPGWLKFDRRLMDNMLNYGFFIMIAGFAGIMNETLDRIMIPYLWEDGKLFDGVAHTGKSLNGIYGANYKVAMLIALATQAFRYAAEPFFFKEAENKDSPRTFARVFHYFLLAALTGFLVIGSFVSEIEGFNLFGLVKGTFVGKEFWAGQKVVPILLLAYVFSAAYINMSIWFKITKQTRFAILFTGVGALITILVNFFGIPTYGYMASAWATLICYLTMAVLVYVVGQKYYPIPYRVRRSLLYLVLFLGAYFLNRSIGPTDGFALAFLMKSMVILAVLGVVYAAERFKPVF